MGRDGAIDCFYPGENSCAPNTHGGRRRINVHAARFCHLACDEHKAALHQTERRRIVSRGWVVDEAVDNHARGRREGKDRPIRKGKGHAAPGFRLNDIVLEDLHSDNEIFDRAIHTLHGRNSVDCFHLPDRISAALRLSGLRVLTRCNWAGQTRDNLASQLRPIWSMDRGGRIRQKIVFNPDRWRGFVNQ